MTALHRPCNLQASPPEIELSHLFVITFAEEAGADSALREIRQLHAQGQINLEDGAYVTHDTHGHHRIHQLDDHALQGAARGGATGVLVGTLLAMPVAVVAPGAAVLAFALSVAGGAGLGARMSEQTDTGIDDKFIAEVGAELRPGTAAVVALIASPSPHQVRPMLAKLGGAVFHTSLSPGDRAHLQAQIATAQAHARATSSGEAT
jgi:uncharacterized membrane protein